MTNEELVAIPTAKTAVQAGWDKLSGGEKYLSSQVDRSVAEQAVFLGVKAYVESQTDMQKLLSILGDTPHKIDEPCDLACYGERIPAVVHTVEVGNTLNNHGYVGFVGVWLFDAGGKFLAVGHYE